MSIQFVGQPDGKGNISCVCPYHNDHSPSASYSIPLELFYCFSCGATANKQKLERDFGPIDLLWEGEFKRNLIDWDDRYRTASTTINEYALRRLLTQEVADEYGIRFTVDSVLFPLTNNIGDMIGVQVRQIGGTPKYLTLLDTEKPMLTPMHLWNPEEYFYIVEGTFGMLRMRQAGFNAFAALGAGVVRKHLSVLSMYGNKFTVIYDNDKAGIKAALRMGYATGCKVHIPGIAIDEVPLKHVWLHADNSGTVHQFADYLRDN